VKVHVGLEQLAPMLGGVGDKVHEETWRGSLGDLARRAAETPPRGEITVVVGGAPQSDAASTTLEVGPVELERLVGQRWSRSSAAREVARRTRLMRRSSSPTSRRRKVSTCR
jgi:16S rRNA C1402 (ribose-2'-O) methylase RsmI